MPPAQPPLGARVQAKEGTGIVKFVGTTEFAVGVWVGIELDTPTGKNDGSVRSKRYFTCPSPHGLFTKPTQVKLLSPPPSSAASSSPTSPRPSATGLPNLGAGGGGRPESSASSSNNNGPQGVGGAALAARRASLSRKVSGGSAGGAASTSTAGRPGAQPLQKPSASSSAANSVSGRSSAASGSGTGTGLRSPSPVKRTAAGSAGGGLKTPSKLGIAKSTPASAASSAALSRNPSGSSNASSVGPGKAPATTPGHARRLSAQAGKTGAGAGSMAPPPVPGAKTGLAKSGPGGGHVKRQSLSGVPAPPGAGATPGTVAARRQSLIGKGVPSPTQVPPPLPSTSSQNQQTPTKQPTHGRTGSKTQFGSTTPKNEPPKGAGGGGGGTQEFGSAAAAARKRGLSINTGAAGAGVGHGARKSISLAKGEKTPLASAGLGSAAPGKGRFAELQAQGAGAGGHRRQSSLGLGSKPGGGGTGGSRTVSLLSEEPMDDDAAAFLASSSGEEDSAEKEREERQAEEKRKKEMEERISKEMDEEEAAIDAAGEEGGPESPSVRKGGGGHTRGQSISGGGAQQMGTNQDPFSLVNPQPVMEKTVPLRQHEEILTKLRIMEARRQEDREKLRSMDKMKEEMEEIVKLKPKLVSKIQELNQEVKDLKKQNKDLEGERDKLESRHNDLMDQVEMATLDKEMAEEQYEACTSSLEGMKERVAELEVEVGVLRKEQERLEAGGAIRVHLADGDEVPSDDTSRTEVESEEDGGDSEKRVKAPEKTSLAFVQLQKQNERLKDALVRMRDLLNETESDHRRKVSDLERELELTSDIQTMYEKAVSQLDEADAQIDDLKTQLDDASGAHDLLEQLTERNLSLSEKVEEMRAIIEDLEALKELNDELEENHIETEKQLQEEIELKDIYLREQKKRMDTYEESVADYENTIQQFRELVVSLQTDLEQLREQHHVQQTESQNLSSQSQAMLNLNLKLQSSKLKGQVKTLDLELRRLDAQQAVQHLEIVRPYLVPSFFDADHESVDSLLFFERLVYKANLISTTIEQNNNVTESLNSTVPEHLVTVCEARTKFARFSTFAKRFASHFKRCLPETFLKMGGIHHEISGIERKLDAFIDLLRREELREAECAREVDGFIAQIKHMAEIYLTTQELALGDREVGQITTFDLDLDTIASAIGFTKQTLAVVMQSSEVEKDLGGVDLNESLFTPLQQIINQARTSKITSNKLLRRIRDVVGDSGAIALEHSHGLANLSKASEPFAGALAKFAEEISHYVSDIRLSKRPFTLAKVVSLAQDALQEMGKKPNNANTPWQDMNDFASHLNDELNTVLTTATDPEHCIKLAYERPWLGRVRELQSMATVNVDSERKIVRLNEELRDLVREMRVKDEVIQETGVKIELMEKRMESVKKQADAIAELESELAKSKKQAKDYEEAIETLQGDLDNMEQENVKLKNNAPSAPSGPTQSHPQGETETSVSYENMETSRLIEQLESLRNAVRFLRSENSYLKSQDLLAELNALPSYELPSSLAPTTPEEPEEPKGLPIPARPPPVSTEDPSDRIRALTSQSKQLFREAILLSSTPKIVDLSKVKPGKAWMPQADKPEIQLRLQREKVQRLSKRLQGLRQEIPMMPLVRVGA